MSKQLALAAALALGFAVTSCAQKNRQRRSGRSVSLRGSKHHPQR